jgi:preprotein translocase subunit SecB
MQQQQQQQQQAKHHTFYINQVQVKHFSVHCNYAPFSMDKLNQTKPGF